MINAARTGLILFIDSGLLSLKLSLVSLNRAITATVFSDSGWGAAAPDGPP